MCSTKKKKKREKGRNKGAGVEKEQLKIVDLKIAVSNRSFYS